MNRKCILMNDIKKTKISKLVENVNVLKNNDNNLVYDLNIAVANQKCYLNISLFARSSV